MDRNTQLNYIDVDVTVKDIDYIYHKSRPYGFSFLSKNRAYYSLAIVMSGTAELDYGYKKEIAQKGDILFLKKGETYKTTVTSREPWEHVVISFKLADENLAQLPFDTVNKTDCFKRNQELFLLAHSVWYRCRAAYKIQTKTIVGQIIYGLLIEKIDQLFGKDTSLTGVKAAADYIEENYACKITVEKLSELSGYSPSHFTRLFIKTYSVSPIDYLINVRITHAKNLLRTRLYTVGEVASMCGFLNVYYFSRLFKQKTGVTPKNY